MKYFDLDRRIRLPAWLLFIGLFLWDVNWELKVVIFGSISLINAILLYGIDKIIDVVATEEQKQASKIHEQLTKESRGWSFLFIEISILVFSILMVVGIMYLSEIINLPNF